MEVITIPVSEVVFREDLYPRMKTCPVTVQKYAEDLSVLPPIEVNQRNELIDGWHRWTAHRKNEAAEIRAVITETTSDEELLEFAIERNATHGLQLTQSDKKDMAVRIYKATPLNEQGNKKERLATILSVTLRSVQTWLSRTDKDNKEKRDCAVRDMWLACHTQDQIAAAIGMTQQGVDRVLQQNETFRFAVNPGEKIEIENNEERLNALEEQNRGFAFHNTEFEKPIYNIWKQQTKTAGSSHFGNSEVRWLDNLLYLYTQPFDIVVDPFAGGGSTIDICRKRFRRYWVSDRKPIVERQKDIRQHDITEGLPALPRWKDVKLVYLDPPYWWQAKEEYSKDASDLGNMPLDEFNLALSGLITDFSKKLSNAYIALIIQPTQWNAPNREYTDHVGDMLRAVKLPVDMRFSVPYESQQCMPQMVDWAKENKKCLVLTREIVVWKA